MTSRSSPAWTKQGARPASLAAKNSHEDFSKTHVSLLASSAPEPLPGPFTRTISPDPLLPAVIYPNRSPFQVHPAPPKPSQISQMIAIPAYHNSVWPLPSRRSARLAPVRRAPRPPSACHVPPHVPPWPPSQKAQARRRSPWFGRRPKRREKRKSVSRLEPGSRCRWRSGERSRRSTRARSRGKYPFFTCLLLGFVAPSMGFIAVRGLRQGETLVDYVPLTSSV